MSSLGMRDEGKTKAPYVVLRASGCRTWYQKDEIRQVAIWFDQRLRRTRGTLSHCDISEMMTLSPTARPFLISTVFTEVRPSSTVIRVASLPSSLTLNRPT